MDDFDFGNVRRLPPEMMIANNGPMPPQGGVPMAPFGLVPSPVDPNAKPDMSGIGQAAPQVRAPAKVDDEDSPDDASDDEKSDDDSKPAKKDPLAQFHISKEDLEEAAANKKRTALIGGLTNILGNQQSFGNFFTGKMNPHTDTSGYFKQMADLANQPIEQKQILLKQAMEEPGHAFTLQASDPTSEYSGIMRKVMAGNIQNNHQLEDDDKAVMIKQLEGKSAFELNQLASAPGYKEAIAQDKFIQGLQAKLDAAQLNMQKWAMGQDRADGRANIHANAQQGRTDNAVFGSVQRQMEPMAQQSRNIDKALEQFNDPKHPPNWTQMSEIAQDISAALSNSKVSSDFKLKSIEKHTMDQYLKDAETFMTSNPDQPASPEVVAFWRDMATRLKGVYDRQIKAKAQNLANSAPDSIKDAVQKSTSSYIKGSWNDAPPEEMVNMRDPKTGKIHAIQAKDVNDAKAAGGVVVTGG